MMERQRVEKQNVGQVDGFQSEAVLALMTSDQLFQRVLESHLPVLILICISHRLARLR